MSFVDLLKESLDTQSDFDGIMDSRYVKSFKSNGQSYDFVAESIAGTNVDETEWVLWMENSDTHRLTSLDNDKKVINAFTKHINEWVKNYDPFAFKFNGSHFETIGKIAEGLKKKVKGYNVVDETKDRKDESGEMLPGNPVGAIKWTKMVIEKDTSTEEMSNKKNDEFEQTYEEVEDIKLNKKYTKAKTDEKLDDAKKAYGESFAEFKARKLNEANEEEDLDDNDLPPDMLKDYEERASAERKAGGSIEINDAIPYVAIEMSDGSEYFFQYEEASELLDSVPENINADDFILAIAQNW